MIFDHPADAMRAKIEDNLKCVWCKHFRLNVSLCDWCTEERYAPKATSNLHVQYCYKFQRAVACYPLTGWSVEQHYFKPESAGPADTSP